VPFLSKTYFNIPLHALSQEEALQACQNACSESRVYSLFFINAHCFNVAQQNDHYRQVIQNADLVLNDGIGIKIGSWFTDVKLKANLNGTDFIPKLLQKASQDQKSVFLLGGKEGVAEQATQNLKKTMPNLVVAGFSNGYFSDQHTIIDKINLSTADILIVGMGVPQQELWIYEHKSELTTR
jgi:N-acetylglucosaminyldiphosphoundecaprenol N-acetyl-beta-D-mannosaminyltransferase